MYCANLQCPDFLECGIHAEYRDGITACQTCGASLVPEKPQPTSAVSYEEPIAHELPPLPGPLVTVAAFNYRQDADLVVSMLVASGINAIVAGDDCGSFDPGLGFGTRSRVLVDASQLEAATALLEQEAPEGEPGGA